MDILLIEDERKIADFVIEGFMEAGMVVQHEADGFKGLNAALGGTFDVIVLDLMLPIIDGISLLEELRQRGNHTPVIVLSAKAELQDKLSGFTVGADDYLAKPFYMEELLARVQVVVQRKSGQFSTTLSHKGLSVDRMTRRTTWQGTSLVLSQKEYLLVAYLLQSPGHIFSRKKILQHVWQIDFDPQTNVVDVCVQRIRKKFSKSTPSEITDFPLETIRGVGYRIFSP